MIYKTNIDGKLLKKYSSTINAAKDLGVSTSTIRRALKKTWVVSGKYYFTRIEPKKTNRMSFLSKSKYIATVLDFNSLDNYKNNLIIFVNEKHTSGSCTAFTDIQKALLNNEIYQVTKFLNQ